MPTPVQQTQPEVVDQDAVSQRDRERRRQRAAAGRRSTILTGPSGAATPTGASKTLLGG